MPAVDAREVADVLARTCGTTLPGAAVALSDGQSVLEVGHGVSSLRTGVPVTPRTLYQVGSISKVYTAVLVMQLVDRGAVELDAPVRCYLPWFRLADDEAAATVTVRHLLTHTAGFEGDVFTDTGHGDDALRRYVEALRTAAQLHSPGAMFSYSNSGYSVLGHLVEAVTGRSWDDVLQSTLAAPLGLTLATLPEQVLLHRYALGHAVLPSPEMGGDSSLQVVPTWTPPRAAGPAGTVCSSAGDVLAFGRMHLAGGLASDGTRVLSEASVAAMRQEHVRFDDPWTVGHAWGLGWCLSRPDVIGHDGGTFGQSAFFRLHPESGVALALLTNGPGAHRVFRALYDEFFAPLAGLPPASPAEPPRTRLALDDGERYAGVYERLTIRFEVRRADEFAVDVTIVPLGDVAASGPEPSPMRFVCLDGDVLVSEAPDEESGLHAVARFVVADGDTRAGWLHLGGRATPRVSG